LEILPGNFPGNISFLSRKISNLEIIGNKVGNNFKFPRKFPTISRKISWKYFLYFLYFLENFLEIIGNFQEIFPTYFQVGNYFQEIVGNKLEIFPGKFPGNISWK
jgi:hypothetical protein